MFSLRKTIQFFTVGFAMMVLQSCGGEETFTYKNPANSNSGWQIEWFDEFSGDNIDTDKWSWVQDCYGGGNNERQCYTDRSVNSYIDDGKLIIKALEENFTGPNYPEDYTSEDYGWITPYDHTLPYTSARLRTKHKGDWKYGLIEIRAKLPSGQGIWPAIWMMPTDNEYGSWPLSGEIDIVEAINLQPDEPGTHKIHGTIHFGYEYDKNEEATSEILLAKDPSSNFHTYSIEWSEDKIRWYVDGVRYGTKTSSEWFTSKGGIMLSDPNAPFDEKFHLILNVAVGGKWPGYPDASTTFPVQMEVDYVRVFSCPDSPNTLTSCQ